MDSSDYNILLKIKLHCHKNIYLAMKFNEKREEGVGLDEISLFSMYLSQIGKLSANLSDEFKAQYKIIPWNDLIEMSDKISSDLLSLKVPDIWDISGKVLPKLREICDEELGDDQYKIEW